MPETVETGSLKPRIQFIADGKQKEFQFFFPIYEAENVKVYLEENIQHEGYSLQKIPNIQGGIIIFNEPPKNGTLITIFRSLPLKRTTDFKEGGPFRSSQVNHEFDYQLSCLEQVEDSIGRTVTFPPYAPTNLNINLPMPDAGKSIIWSDNEQSLINSQYAVDNIVNQSQDYCRQTTEHLQTVSGLSKEVSVQQKNIQQIEQSVIHLQQISEQSVQQAKDFARKAAQNTVNSLYNQSAKNADFSVILQDGISIYLLPTITQEQNIVFDFSHLSNHADIVTFELYLQFSTFCPVTFNNINVTWFNGKVPNLEQGNTLTKILTFRNKLPGKYTDWIVSMEGGF